MRNLLFSLFAIAVASVAAMTATTALLNAPQRPATVVETAALVDPPEGARIRKQTGDHRGCATGHAGRHTRHRQARERFCRRPGGRRRGRQGSLRRHRGGRAAAGSAIQRGLERELPHQHLTRPCTASTSTTTRCPSHAMASCLRASRWRSRPPTGEARAGAAALATARGRPDEVSLNHWRELGRNEFAARNVAREMIVQLRTLGISERIDAVVAVPADLDPGVLADAAWRAACGRRRYARLRRLGGTGCRGDRRTRPLRVARSGLALRHGHARVGRWRMRGRRSLRE